MRIIDTRCEKPFAAIVFYFINYELSVEAHNVLKFKQL